MPERMRVAVVDDHPLWREGVANTLAAEPDFEMVGEGGSADDAFRIAQDLLPDILLLDISMPGGGIHAAQVISKACPVVNIIVLTVSEDQETVLAALKAGARGYVLKGVGGPELLRILRGVGAGENYITPSLAADLLLESQQGTERAKLPTDPLSELTRREREILKGLARGHSNKQIASELCLSEKTVKPRNGSWTGCSVRKIRCVTRRGEEE